jgi:hypothetical protein
MLPNIVEFTQARRGHQTSQRLMQSTYMRTNSRAKAHLHRHYSLELKTSDNFPFAVRNLLATTIHAKSLGSHRGPVGSGSTRRPPDNGFRGLRISLSYNHFGRWKSVQGQRWVWLCSALPCGAGTWRVGRSGQVYIWVIAAWDQKVSGRLGGCRETENCSGDCG